MPRKPLPSPARAKNTPSIAAVGVFLILAGLFWPGTQKAAASFTFYTGFESSEGYATGTIAGQNGWTAGTDYCSVDTAQFYSGSQSMNCPVGGAIYWAKKDLTEESSGQLEFYFYPTTLSNQPIISFFDAAGNALFDANPVGLNNSAGWNFHRIQWTGFKWRYSVNASSTNWFDFAGGDPAKIKIITAGGIGEANWFDDLSWGTEENVVGSVVPVFPVGIATIPNGIFNAIGSYTYGTSSDFFISDLGIVLTNASDTTIQFVYNFDVSSSTAGSYSMPVKLSNGIWDLKYRFIYNVPQISITQGAYLNPFLTYDVFYYYPDVATTTIFVGSSFYSATTSPEFQLPELQDCSILSGVENWLCQIKNLLTRIFVPSQAKVAELTESMKSLNTKFPSNYLAVAYDFFSDVKAGINASSSITFKILGNTGTVDFSFLNSTSTPTGNSTQTFGNVLRGFFGFVCLLEFTNYAINFGKRIF